jgi:hypothetical protein
MKNIPDKSHRETRNSHFMFNNFPPPPDNFAVFEITWKNIVERSRPHGNVALAHFMLDA